MSILEHLSGILKNKLSKPLILVAFCFIFYGNTIQNHYALDDGMVITENQFVKKGLLGIPEIVKHNTLSGCLGEDAKLISGGRYRPLSLITFAFEYQMFGANPHLSHLINILLFAALALLLYFLLLKIFSQYAIKDTFFDFPFITVLLFIAHPIHTEVVANIKGRDEIMALGGSLAALYFVLKYMDTNKFRDLMLIFFFSIISLFSKENAITFLAIIPLTIYFYKQEKWSTYLYSITPSIISVVVFLVIRKLVLGENNPPPDELLNNPFIYTTVAEKFATVFYTLGMYIKLLFWPHPLTYDYYPYHIPVVNWNNAFALVSLAVYIFIIVYAIVKLPKKSVISYGILFYLITLSIVSNLFFHVGTFMSERFIFTPSIGFVIIIAWLFTMIFPKYVRLNYLKVPVFIILLTLCFVKTYSRNKIWNNNFTLFTTDAITSCNSAKGNIAAGNVWFAQAFQTTDSTLKEEYLNNALQCARRAVLIHPKHIDAMFLLGNTYNEAGILDSALFCYKKAIDLMPDKTDLIASRILLTLNKFNDVDFKINEYLKFLEQSPYTFDFNYQLGLLFGRYKNDYKNSILFLNRALIIRPNDQDATLEIGQTYKLTGEYDKSSQYLELFLQNNPDNLEALQNLYTCYHVSGKKDKETEVLNRIYQLKNTNFNK